MPRKNKEMYREYMRHYMSARRKGLTSGLTGINKNPLVEIGGFEPPTFAMRTRRSPY
jgi:hypothetical protein